MKTPRHLHAYDDRHLDCAFALEPMLLDLLNQAAAAGWDRKETVGAIASVIANVLLADIANLKAEVAISAARNLN
jgi:hypothetical protein